MQLSLSKKDVAQLHVMLSTLPIPPLPVLLKMDVSKMSAGDTRTSFEMATVQIVKDAQCEDNIVNSHSIIASMSFFSQWNSINTNDEAKRVMMHEKEAVILSLIKNVIRYSETCKKKCKSYNDKEIGDLFLEVSRAWVHCALPVEVQLQIELCSDLSRITYEHPLHVAMAHYCYSQGVLYSNKTSKLCCEVHTGFQEVYANGPTRLNQEHLQIAEMYSTFSYVKLLNLCFTRLLKDSLYGHNYNEHEDVYQNAKDLLDLSVINYNKVVNPVLEVSNSIQQTAKIIDDISHVPSIAEEDKTIHPEQTEAIDIIIDVTEEDKTVTMNGSIEIAKEAKPHKGAPCGHVNTMDSTIPIAEEAKPHNPSGDPEGGAPCGHVNTMDSTIPIAEEAKLVNTIEMTIQIAEEDKIISPLQ